MSTALSSMSSTLLDVNSWGKSATRRPPHINFDLRTSNSEGFPYLCRTRIPYHAQQFSVTL